MYVCVRMCGVCMYEGECVCVCVCEIYVLFVQYFVQYFVQHANPSYFTIELWICTSSRKRAIIAGEIEK